MKTHTTTLRLSDGEHRKLQQDASSAKMSTSQYLRALINGTTPTAENHQQEIVTLLCKINIHLSELGLNENYSLMEELNTVCQMLS